MYISFYVDVIVKLVDIYIFWLKGKMLRKRIVIIIDGNSLYIFIVIRDFFF